MSDPAEQKSRQARADALLGQIARDGRSGTLKVFLGAAPGVGKTYAMLSAARELRRQGVDVVVGLVETHGRAETQALLEGLELLPRRRSAAGTAHDEFDVDAALARRPQLILVDELAHRNVGGSRHERRYQDIEELLDAGLDVYTTVNIQHLESLNDVVQQITGVRVRETVPDAFLDRARDMVLIDLPPRELIERLRQGKIYLPELAASALERFFSASNLTALRELAVQAVADRVDADLREYQTAHGGGPVPVRRRVLVAIDGSGNSEYLVRVARRIAERRQAPWTVAHVDTGRDATDAERQSRIEAALRLARRLGAETEILRGIDVADELLGFAGRHSVATIIVGRTRERPLARLLNRTLTQRLLRRGAHVELTIVATPLERARARRALGQGEIKAPLRDVGFALGISLAALILAHFADRVLSVSNLSQIFIVAVMLVAVRSRMSVAVLSAVVCFFGYNFFFAPPRYTLAIANGGDALTVVLFLATALICSRLATRLTAQVAMLRDANAHARVLGRLGRELAAAAEAGQVAAIGARTLAQTFDAEAAVLTPDTADATLAIAAATPRTFTLNATDRAAADWALQHDQPAGRHTDTLNAATCWLLPLREGEQRLGVIALRFGTDDAAPSPQRRDLVQAIVQDIAQALARTRLADALENARIQGETERLRAALLSSVSHDLRSPLSAMLGSAESLQRYGAQMPADDRDTLLAGIVGEGQRLDRYIQNLLDMTRLGYGTLTLARDWVAVDEIVGAAVQRLRKLFPEVPVERVVAAGLPLLHVHPALIEQALFNILENAAKFSPAATPVRVRVERSGDWLHIDVVDAGPGIPAEDRARIFDMFYSMERGDRGKHGTGLGLAICQGMVGAHGGSVQALPGDDGHGTTIRVSLPLAPAPEEAQA
ncbi:ATP-binding protein [Tahibacter sp. UC22_41]|uniref:ATP-binding protein n=1 Tax=Tahibacter sp. UC22_41 TaxID=3350178 RepID=UPI0036DBB912